MEIKKNGQDGVRISRRHGKVSGLLLITFFVGSNSEVLISGMCRVQSIAENIFDK